VQQDALVDLGDVEQVADVHGGQTDKVSQRNDCSLVARERVHGVEQVRPKLGAEEPGLGIRVEARWRARPAPVGAEGTGLERRGVVNLERGERQASRVADGAGAGLVDEDAEDPCPQGGSALEVAQAPDDAEPRVLDDVVDRGGRAHERPGDPAEGAIVPGHERREGFLVAGAQTGEKRLVVFHRLVNLPFGRRTSHGPRGERRGMVARKLGEGARLAAGEDANGIGRLLIGAVADQRKHAVEVIDEPVRHSQRDHRGVPPDWQPLPITVGAPDEARTACGDLSLLPGGVASIVAVKSKCHIALAIAADWQGSARLAAPAERLKSYECASHPHSFDEGLVQCDHRGGKKAIAFVYRELPAAPVLDAAAGLAAREFDTNAADTLVGRTFELEQIVNELFTL
jgi:hypothetical protein